MKDMHSLRHDSLVVIIHYHHHHLYLFSLSVCFSQNATQHILFFTTREFGNQSGNDIKSSRLLALGAVRRRC